MNRRSLAVLLALCALALIGGGASHGAEQTTDYPEDIAAVVAGTPEPGEYLTRTAALAVADRLHEFIPDTASVDAYLVQATEAGTAKSRNPIVDRAVWLVRYSGFRVHGQAPMQSDGKPSETTPYTLAYVFVDAVTGEWLGTRLEGTAQPATAN